ncbi:pectinesterase family protein [Alicyclobacillus herbarius]|uniref:pectinesterase family protein n=1 Tax=Alicyclobacillus herbarius TaxID=122960 RepID=UPI0003F9AC82|nr:pectinesterase family protein [Alicyclobacillus herbarius]
MDVRNWSCWSVVAGLTVLMATSAMPVYAKADSEQATNPAFCRGGVPQTHPKHGPVLVVAADGSGEFTTIQDAVNAVPDNSDVRYTILVKKGTYWGTVHIPSSKLKVSLIGATGNPKDVVLVDDHANGMLGPDGKSYGTSGSATVTVDASNFTARNVTFENAFDPNAHPEIKNQQAVAVKTTGDKVVYVNDRFIGRQDTLYAAASSGKLARQVYERDYIEGTVDFIFGSATAVFDHDVIHALAHLGGTVTAASTPADQNYGFLIVNSRITSDRALAPESYYLGRPWPQYGTTGSRAQVTVRNTWISKAINTEHWCDWTSPPFAWRDARFYEYHNRGPGARQVADDVPQLTSGQAQQFTIAHYLAGWDPKVQ